MSVILKILIPVLLGIFISLCAYSFFSSVAASFKKIRQAAEKIKGKAGEEKAAGRPHLARVGREAVSILKTAPNSGPAVLFRILIGGLIGLLVVLFSGKVIFGLLFFVFGFFAPVLLLKRQKKKHLSLFEDQLTDALGMIANSVRAGSSILQAFEIVSKESSPPLAEEFNEALRKIRLGTPMAQALKEMTERIPSRNLHLSVMTINVAREFGGNIGENLLRIVTLMRERKKIDGKIQAITAQGKLSGWIVTFVPLFLLAVLNWMEPELFGLMFSSIIGNILLAVSILMVSLGNYVIMKIVTIDI